MFGGLSKRGRCLQRPGKWWAVLPKIYSCKRCPPAPYFARDSEVAHRVVVSTRANLPRRPTPLLSSPSHMTCLICDGGLRLLACHGRATHADGLKKSADGGHVVCQSCIETWFDAQKELHAKSDIVPLLHPTCPVCKCALRTGSTRGDASRFLGLPRIADAQTTSADPDGFSFGSVPSAAVRSCVAAALRGVLSQAARSAAGSSAGRVIVAPETLDLILANGLASSRRARPPAVAPAKPAKRAKRRSKKSKSPPPTTACRACRYHLAASDPKHTCRLAEEDEEEEEAEEWEDWDYDSEEEAESSGWFGSHRRHRDGSTWSDADPDASVSDDSDDEVATTLACRGCGRICAGLRGLKAHKRACTPAVAATPPPPSLECSACGKTCGNVGARTLHERVCTGAPPPAVNATPSLECSHCGKTCGSDVGRKLHERVCARRKLTGTAVDVGRRPRKGRV